MMQRVSPRCHGMLTQRVSPRCHGMLTQPRRYLPVEVCPRREFPCPHRRVEATGVRQQPRPFDLATVERSLGEKAGPPAPVEERHGAYSSGTVILYGGGGGQRSGLCFPREGESPPIDRQLVYLPVFY